MQKLIAKNMEKEIRSPEMEKNDEIKEKAGD